MVKKVYTTGLKTTIPKIAKQMMKHKISSIIIEDKKEPVGIITERDIVTRVIATQINPAKLTAEEIMTKPVVAVLGETPLTDAIDLMKDKSIRRLVVVNDDNETIGILTVDDIGYNVERFAEDIGIEYLIMTQTIRDRRP